MNLIIMLAIFTIGLVCGHRLRTPLAQWRERYQRRHFKPQLIKRYTPPARSDAGGRAL